MIRLAISNSFSQIIGLSSEQFQELRQELSAEEVAYGYAYLNRRHLPMLRPRGGAVYFKDASGIPRPVLNKRLHKFRSVAEIEKAIAAKEHVLARGYVVKYKTLLGKSGDFASGLILRVQKWLRSKCLNAYSVDDQRKQPIPNGVLFTLIKSLTPYPEQTEAVEAAVANKRGIIAACTGFGKSITMALLVAALQLRALIVVPNLNLRAQLRATFLELFGSLDNITIENVDSPVLKKQGNYDVLILDEAHHSACATIRKLNKKLWAGIYYRYFFTGTPYRSRSAEQIVLESVTGDTIYSIPYRNARDRGYVVPVECYFVNLPRVATSNSKSWPTVYSELVVKNRARNAIIAALLKNLHAAGESALCLVKEVAHGLAIRDLTGAAFAHGEEEETPNYLSWFADGKLKTLVATTGVAGEGSDTRACGWVFIAAGGKSRPAFVQQVGRGIRRFPGKDACRVVLFRDASSQYLLDHFEQQVSFMRDEFGAEAAELPIPEAV